MTDREQVIFSILEDKMRAFGLIIDADSGHQRRENFPFISRKIFGDGHTNTARLVSCIAHITMVRRKGTHFLFANDVRTPLTRHVTFKHHVEFTVMRIDKRAWIPEVPVWILAFSLVI